MGTRAMISFDGKPGIATHWDGDPGCLGQHLLECADVTAIVYAAAKHSIDAIDYTIVDAERFIMERFKAIADKANACPGKPGTTRKKYTAKSLLKLYVEDGKQVSFAMMASDDYPIGAIADYGDWAEYQYDVRKAEDGTLKVFVAKLHGEWNPEAKRSYKLLRPTATATAKAGASAERRY